MVAEVEGREEEERRRRNEERRREEGQQPSDSLLKRTIAAAWSPFSTPESGCRIPLPSQEESESLGSYYPQERDGDGGQARATSNINVRSFEGVSVAAAVLRLLHP